MGSIFVLMPFKEEFDDVYMIIQDAIRETAEKLGRTVECLRADEIAKPGRITDQVLTSIGHADVVIADITFSNPNVMYELGYAHAMQKPVIILNQDVHQSPFDVQNFRQIVYDRTRMVKDCRPRIIAAVIDVIGSETTSNEGSWGGDDHPADPTDALGIPRRPSDGLIAELQSIHLELEDAREHGREADAINVADALVSLVDRIVVPRSTEWQEIRNTAATLGNCAMEISRVGLSRQAEDVFKRAVGLFPDYAGLRLQYCGFLVTNDRLEEAESELSRVRELELEPDDPSRVDSLEQRIALASGDISPKIGDKLVARFLENPGDQRTAVAYLLFLSRTKADPAQFEEACDRIAETSAENRVLARRSFADFLASQNEEPSHQRAIQIYEELLDADETDRHAVLHNLATLYSIGGRHQEARERWLEAYSMNRRDPAVRAAFSQRLARWGEKDLALLVAKGDPLPND